jgi:hypothetical protein
VGNQVISWGESLFIPAASTPPTRSTSTASQPGTQLKEAVLPAPMVSLATGLGPELNFEGYVQAAWNPNFMPPTGGYWSTADGWALGTKPMVCPPSRPRTAASGACRCATNPPTRA